MEFGGVGMEQEARGPMRTAFQPSPVVGAPDQIRHQIVDAVARGELKPGDRLPSEPKLAEQFGVSRSEVKAALQSLADIGVIETSRGRSGGIRIARAHRDRVQTTFRDSLSLLIDLSDLTLAEVVEARREIEAICARVAASRRDEEDLDAMRRAVERSKDPTLTDEEWLGLDIEFHGSVRAAAKNRVLGLPLAAMHAVIQPRLNMLIMPDLDRGTVVAQHQRIYEAIRDRDPDAVTEALHSHVDYLDERYRSLPPNVGSMVEAGAPQEPDRQTTEPKAAEKPSSVRGRRPGSSRSPR